MTFLMKTTIIRKKNCRFSYLRHNIKKIKFLENKWKCLKKV